MLRRTKENFVSLGVILVITVLFLYASLHLEFFESKIMPLFIGGITLLLLMLAFFQEYTKIGCDALSEDEHSSKDIRAHDRHTLKCVLPLFILVALIYVLGFYAATLIFVFAYMKVSGSSVLGSVLISVLGAVFLYGVFVLLLETPLYTGLLMEYGNMTF